MDIITMIGNTGTYLDSPFHGFAGGIDLAGLDLDSLVGLHAEVVHRPNPPARGVPASTFRGRDVAGFAALLHTDWDRHFGTPRYVNDALNFGTFPVRASAELDQPR